MESRFAHLRQRDSSVSMLRVKMSRRRSQSQKENRHRAVNSRRQLDELPEMDCSSRNASVMAVDVSTVQEHPANVTKVSKNEAAAVERMARLQRWKEMKVNQKEKDDRAKQSKGVFKVGLYHSTDTMTYVPLPSVLTVTTRAKETTMKTAQSTRVTRSVRQQQQKPPVEQQRSAAVRKVEPAVSTRTTRSRPAVAQPPPARAATRGRVAIVEPMVQALSTRSGNKPPVAAVPPAKGKPPAEARVTRSRVNISQAAPPPGRGKNNKATAGAKVQPAVPKEPEQSVCRVSPTPCAEKEEEEKKMMMVMEEEEKKKMVVEEEEEEKKKMVEEEKKMVEEEEKKMVEEEKMEEDPAPAEALLSEDPVAPASSFAPQGFVFQAPAGLSSLPAFKFEPLTPRSTGSFLTPTSSFSLPPVPVFNFEPLPEVRGPSPPRSPQPSPPRSPQLSPPKSPQVSPPRPSPPRSPPRSSPLRSPQVSPPRPSPLRSPQVSPARPSPARAPHLSPPHLSPPRPSPARAPPAPGSPQEPQHDVPYFRSEVINQTDRLTSLSHQWESKVDDETIPEEMRDRMRTAVGQARLLIKERFGQFIGLVDDCDLGRGEKLTTCTDLQGFWDMVFYQVEDVSRKFDALREAETRGWVEEDQPPPPPRQRKTLKKRPAPAAPKPAATNPAAAKSRLAAVKAAMKARQQAAEAEKAAQAAADDCADDPGPAATQDPQAQPEPKALVVFHGGFFQVESPAKLPGSVRKSSRPHAAVSPRASPCSKLATPGRAPRCSAALSFASPQPTRTPMRLTLTPAQSPCLGPEPGTPQPPQSSEDTATVSLRFSPIHETPSENGHPEEHHPETVSRQDDVSPDCREPGEPEGVAVPEVSGPVTTQLPPSSTPAQRLSPCPPPTPPSRAPECSAASLSFNLSPPRAQATPARPTTTDTSLPLLSSPYVLPSLPALGQAPLLTEDSVVDTPDTSALEGVPELDFERYLQPSERCSLSPRETTIEMLSPMATDFEMESPVAQPVDLTLEEDIMTPTALPGFPLVFTPQSQQNAESDFLLFSPDPTGRIRASVCPSDLMVFTPPFKK